MACVEMVISSGCITTIVFILEMFHIGRTGSGRILIDGEKVNFSNIFIICSWARIPRGVVLRFAVGRSVLETTKVQFFLA